MVTDLQHKGAIYKLQIENVELSSNFIYQGYEILFYINENEITPKLIGEPTKRNISEIPIWDHEKCDPKILHQSVPNQCIRSSDIVWV